MSRGTAKFQLLGVSAALFVFVVVQVAVAGSGERKAGPVATASGPGQKKQLKKLNRKVKSLQRAVAALQSGQGTPTTPAAPTAPATPTGAAGGDLAGTYPDPQIAAGAITAAEVAAANIDGAAAVPSLRTLGVGAAQAAAGDDPRLSDARPPTGTAGGDLTGSTYPNPTLGTGAIDSTGLFNASLLDGAAATPTLRSLGTGAAQATAGNDSRLSDTRVPTDGSVTTAKFAALPVARATQTIPQTFDDAVIETVELDTADTSGSISFDDATDRLSILTSGFYLVTGEVIWTAATGGIRQASVFSAALGEITADERLGGSATQSQTMTTVVRLAAGDTLEMNASQATGGFLDTHVVDSRSAALGAAWLGP